MIDRSSQIALYVAAFIARSLHVVAIALSALLVTTACGGARSAAGSEPNARSTSTAAAPTPPPPLAGEETAGVDRPTFLVQDGLGSRVWSVALSRDGKIVATGSFDGAVRVWDTATGLIVHRVVTGSSQPNVSISADGDVLAYTKETPATADHPGKRGIAVADLATSAPPILLDEAMSFELYPDGRSILLNTGSELRRVSTKTGAPLEQADLGGSVVYASSIDRAGKQIIAGTASEILLLDVDSLKIVRRWTSPGSATHDLPAEIASGDGAFAVRSIQGAVYVFGLGATATPYQIQGDFRLKQSIAILGDELYTRNTANRLERWEIGAGRALPSPLQESGSIFEMWLSRDGGVLAFSTIDITGALGIRMEDAHTRRAFRTLEGRYAGVTAMAASPDGSILLAGSSVNAISRWDLRTGELLRTSHARGDFSVTESLAFDKAGTIVVSSMSSFDPVRIHDAKTQRLLRQWSPLAAPPQPLDRKMFALLMPDSPTLLTIGGSEVTSWDLSGAAPPARGPLDRKATLNPPTSRPVVKLAWPASAAALSPDGARLAVFGGDSLALIDTKRGAILWTTKTALRDAHIAFAPSGDQILLSSMPLAITPPARFPIPELRVYSAARGSLERTLYPGTEGPIAVRPGLVALGGEAPAVLAWPDGSLLHRIDINNYKITSVTAHPARDLFLFGGDSGGISAVEARAGNVLAVLVSTPDGEYVTATPEGIFRASADGARRIAWAFPAPLEGFSFEQFAARLNQPDVIARRLAGEDIPANTGVHRPPRVRLATGPAASSTASRSARLGIAAAAVRPIDRVRVYVNGMPAHEAHVGATTAQLDLSVPLGPGLNRVTVMAYDTDGFASNPRAIDIVSTSKDAPAPDLWLISLGVSTYKELPPEFQLSFADDDARAVAGALRDRIAAGDGRFAHVHEILLTDSDVTVDRALEALSGLSAMRPEDLAIVFLAGHGVKLPDGKMVFLTSPSGMTAESARANGIGWDRVQGALAKARGRVVLLLDACHSGHFLSDGAAANDAFVNEMGGGRAWSPGVLVLAAARGSQVSYEVGGDAGSSGASRGLELAWSGKPADGTAGLAKQHGLFTAALLEALSGAATDRDGSSAIELSELVAYVTERVRDASNGAQTPWVTRREMFGDFAVAPASPRGADPAPAK